MLISDCNPLSSLVFTRNISSFFFKRDITITGLFLTLIAHKKIKHFCLVALSIADKFGD